MSDHPSFETLLDLTLGDLPDEQAIEVRGHLVHCEICRGQVASLLDESETPPDGVEPLADADRQAAWRQLTGSLAQEGLIPESTPAPAPPALDFPGRTAARPAAGSGRGPSWLAFAATTILSLGLGWLLGQGPEPRPAPLTVVAQLTEVQGDRHVSRGGSEDPTQVQCPETGEAVIWYLGLYKPPPAEAQLSLRIYGPNGAEPPLDAVADPIVGAIRLVRSMAATPPGSYKVSVYRKGEDQTPLENFYLSVQCP